MRLLCAAGARPNFVKIAPILEAAAVPGVDALLVHTHQHSSDRMSGLLIRELGIRGPAVGGAHHAPPAGYLEFLSLLIGRAVRPHG